MRHIKVAVNLGSELLESSLITGARLDGNLLCFTLIGLAGSKAGAEMRSPRTNSSSIRRDMHMKIHVICVLGLSQALSPTVSLSSAVTV